MPYEFFKAIHLLGAFVILYSLGMVLGATWHGIPKKKLKKRFLAIIHGIGMLLAIIGGFGMLSKLGELGWPNWIIGKLAVWIALGATLALSIRHSSKVVLCLILVLATIAVFLGVYKPGY